MRNIGTACLLLLALAACERKQPPINGIDQWVLGKTLLKDATGVCTPDDVTFCSHNGSVALGNQAAAVNLYFDGPEPTAPLVEIALEVRNCEPNGVAGGLVHALGEPKKRAGSRMFWPGEHAFVAAALPASARRCEINFVAPSDRERIADLESAP